MSIVDLNRIIQLGDTCLSLLKDFYKADSSFYDNSEDIFAQYDQQEAELNAGYLNSKKTRVVASKTPRLESRLTPETRFQLKNGLIKPNISTAYNPDTATIGEYENRYLVLILKFISNYLNKMVFNFHSFFFGTSVLPSLSLLRHLRIF